MPKINMSVNINVALSGSQNADGTWNITDSYTQGTTVPASTNVVDSSGNIDLTKMAFNASDYKNDTDIAFILTGTNVRDSNGNPATVYFWSPRSAAITFNPTPRNSEFGDPGDEGSGDILTITDRDNDGGNYSYTLYVSCNGTKVALEPSIVNRTGTN
jgi:hypothetical protein